MAAFNLTITVPDNKVSELVDALNWHYADEQGDANPETAGQLRARVESHTIQALKDIFKRHKEYLREQQAIDDQIAITGT